MMHANFFGDVAKHQTQGSQRAKKRQTFSITKSHISVVQHGARVRERERIRCLAPDTNHSETAMNHFQSSPDVSKRKRSLDRSVEMHLTVVQRD